MFLALLFAKLAENFGKKSFVTLNFRRKIRGNSKYVSHLLVSILFYHLKII